MRPGGDLTSDLRQMQGQGPSALAFGRTRVAEAARAEQTAPQMYPRAARAVPRLARTRVNVPCWPTRASSWSEISIGLRPQAEPPLPCRGELANIFVHVRSANDLACRLLL